MRNRTLQIKLVRDEQPVVDIERPRNPESAPEAIAIEVIHQTLGGVVVGYTICKSVNFFFRMAEHMIVNR